MGYSFRERVLDPSRRVLIYEVVPPEPHTTDRALKRSASTLARMLKGFDDVDAVYVPEVVDEGNGIVRPTRVHARRFASFVRQSYRNDEEHRRKLVVSHPFAYTPKAETENWLRETYNKAGIKNVIIVGPRHETPSLPGYNVAEVARLISEMNSRDEIKIFAGGICIDSRRKSRNTRLNLDEPERMVRKTKSGVMFFASQICYDSQGMIDLLRDYKAESEKQEIEPRRVFIGVSPISSKTTLKVVEGLMERQIEEEPRAYILSEPSGMGNRSIQRIEEMLRRIFDFCYGKKLGVPLGVCVEHVNDSNFRYALELLDSVPEIWREYHPDSEFPPLT